MFVRFSDFTIISIGEICRRNNMDYHCYADDTQIYIMVEPRDTWKDISARLKVCLNDIHEWMRANLLKLNQEKTELMIFAPKNRLVEIEGLSLSFGDNTIHNTPFVKNLGTYFDTSLTMEKHCNALSKSCYFHLRNIGRIRNYITEDAAKTLVNALITSRLDYGNALLLGINKNLTSKLQRVHNTAARIITSSKSTFDHVTPVLIELHWLPVEFRCQFKAIVYVFKALHGQSPTYIRELIEPYVPTRSLRSESSNRLVVPTTRTATYGEKRFDKAASTLWNSLPLFLRQCHSAVTFKKKLKTFLFKKAFSV